MRLAHPAAARSERKILRNAGARVTPDVVRTLVLAVHLLGVKRVIVVPHTKCGPLGAQDDIKAKIAENGGPAAIEADLLTTTDELGTLRADVEKLRAEKLLGDIVVGGAVYDVDTGLLAPLPQD